MTSFIFSFPPQGFHVNLVVVLKQLESKSVHWQINTVELEVKNENEIHHFAGMGNFYIYIDL